MTKYLKTQATAKKGINHIKSIVKRSGCHFFEIRQENDIGLDAIIELYENDIPTGKMFAVQVKSGKSFYTATKQMCKISIEKHRDYWLNHDFPVIGIVYVPALFEAFVVDIKKYLLQNPTATVIKYEASEMSKFNFYNFNNIIKPGRLNLISDEEKFMIFTEEFENKSFRFLINLTSMPLKKVIPALYASSSFVEFIREMEYNIISVNEMNLLKNQYKFIPVSNKWHGVFHYSSTKNICFEEQAVEYFSIKFNELKKILLSDEKK
jgi:hypothetical protein